MMPEDLWNLVLCVNKVEFLSRVLSLSLTVYHVSLVSSVLEAQAQLLLMNAFLDTTVRAGLLQEVSMRHQQVIIR